MVLMFDFVIRSALREKLVRKRKTTDSGDSKNTDIIASELW